MMDHFYTVDQWEFEDDTYWDRKVLIHVPCDESAVNKARYSDTWICSGCFQEPPEAIQDVIRLGKPYKGWDDPSPVDWTNIGSNFYLTPATGLGFYMPMTVNASSPLNDAFYSLGELLRNNYETFTAGVGTVFK